MARDPRLFTTGTTSFPALSAHEPLLQVKAGVPLEEALSQARLLTDLAGTLAFVIATGHTGNELHTSNLACTISLLSDMAYNILSDVEGPVSQLCQGQHPLTPSQER